MGVSKGVGGPVKDLHLAPRQWLLAKEVLVGSGGLGVSRIFPENLPPQALPNPFHSFFSLSPLSSNSSSPQTPPSNSLEQAYISLSTLASPSFSSFSPFLSLRPFLGPY